MGLDERKIGLAEGKLAVADDHLGNKQFVCFKGGAIKVQVADLLVDYLKDRDICVGPGG